MSDALRMQQIRQFLVAAETGSFRAAATATFRSPAAVSTAMQDLERQVGSRLFEDGQRAKLTPLARMLRPLFAELLSTHDRVVHNVKQVTNAEAGSISVAVVPFLAEEWFPTLLLEFLAAHPNVNVTVTEERSPQIHRLVAEGTVDIGICAHVFDDPNLRFHPIAIDAFGIGCAETHPLARSPRAVTWKALNGERLIDSFATLKLHGMGDRVGKTVMSVSSRPSLMELLRRNIGIAVMPRLTKPEWAKGVAFVPLVQPRVTRQIGVMTRQRQTLLPAATNMLAMVAKSLRGYAIHKGAAVYEPDASSIAGQSATRPAVKTAAAKARRTAVRSPPQKKTQ